MKIGMRLLSQLEPPLRISMTLVVASLMSVAIQARAMTSNSTR
jgi:hypothetical protein